MTFAPDSGQTQTISNAIADQTGSGGTGGNAGSWALSKTGAGTLVLGGTNTYSGGTDVTGGTLSISSDANLGNGGTVALGNGTTLDFTAGGTYTHAITVAGDPTFDTNGNTVTENGQITDATGGPPPGEVLVTGGGTLVLGNALNSYSGGTTVIAGSTVSVAVNGDLGATSGGVTLGDATTGGTLATTGSFGSGRTLTLAAGGGTIDTTAVGVTTELTGQVTGAGLLTKTGAGTLILSGSNDRTGGTTVSGGTLQGTTTTLTGDITDNANVTFDQSTAGSYGNVITGSGSLTKSGAGILHSQWQQRLQRRHECECRHAGGHHQQPAGRHPQRCQCHLRPGRRRDLYRHHVGQRQPDQIRHRHGDPLRGEPLHRRHDVTGGTLSISSDANLGTGGTVNLAEGTTLFLHRRMRRLQPRHHGDQ